MFAFFQDNDEFGPVMQTMCFCVHSKYIDTLCVFQSVDSYLKHCELMQTCPFRQEIGEIRTMLDYQIWTVCGSEEDLEPVKKKHPNVKVISSADQEDTLQMGLETDGLFEQKCCYDDCLEDNFNNRQQKQK